MGIKTAVKSLWCELIYYEHPLSESHLYNRSANLKALFQMTHALCILIPFAMLTFLDYILLYFYNSDKCTVPSFAELVSFTHSAHYCNILSTFYNQRSGPNLLFDSLNLENIFIISVTTLTSAS